MVDDWLCLLWQYTILDFLLWGLHDFFEILFATCQGSNWWLIDLHSSLVRMSFLIDAWRSVEMVSIFNWSSSRMWSTHLINPNFSIACELVVCLTWTMLKWRTLLVSLSIAVTVLYVALWPGESYWPSIPRTKPFVLDLTSSIWIFWFYKLIHHEVFHCTARAYSFAGSSWLQMW